jgi:hypothetical protein
MKTLALVLILVALAGAGFSYHLTLDARFAALEQKLDQNSVALQQYQISQETAASSKTEALDHLSKEVDALQTSLKPLGNATKEQTDALTDIRKQVALLQQAPAITPASAPAPVTPVTASVPHVSSATVPMPVPPHADSAVDLRPAQSVMTDDDASVRVLPVALPVALSDLNGR